MQIAQQLHAAGLAVFPCRADKAPAVPRGTNWQDPSNQWPAAQQWPSGLVGLPIPPGVVVLDLDSYKGATRQQVETWLGCQLEWDRALIQQTQNGGQHYAFQVPWEVRQGSNIGVMGFDTRTSGKGYIATGDGYTHVGFGPYAMAHPGTLPALPEAARRQLEHVERQVTAQPLPVGDRDTDAVLEALRHIRPDCGRSEWVGIGLALRHHYHDDEETGFELFRRWSAGELHDEQPHNYDPDTVGRQFMSFKPEGGTTIGTLFHAAMEGGWRPPATVDVAAAFGAGAASMEDYGRLVDRILSEGGSERHTADLVEAVRAIACSPLQRAMLLAALTRELRSADLLTKPVQAQLDAIAHPRRHDTRPKAGPGVIPANLPLHPDSWVEMHTKGKEARPRGTRENFEVLCGAYGIDIRYNVISKEVEIVGPGIPQTGDMANNAALAFIESQAELNEFPHARVPGCVVDMANRRHHNPVLEWVQSQGWDNRDHIGHLWQQIQLDAEEDARTAEVLFRKWIRGAVAVGTGHTNKMEYVLTLVDPQGGKGKTRFFNTLCPPRLQAEGVTLDPANKDSLKHAISYWLVELGELDATFGRADQARLKAHLSNCADEIRLPYAKTADKYPRRTAYFGSVNRPDFLVDESGNRRFWPIRIEAVNYLHQVNVQQVWAQAMAEVQMGHTWHLNETENNQIAERNDAFRPACPVGETLARTFDMLRAPTEHLSVTEILRAAGVFRPTKAELNAAADWLRKSGAKRHKRNGVWGFFVPPAVTPVAEALRVVPGGKKDANTA